MTFHFGLAAILGIGAFFTFRYLSSDAPPLLGLPRKLIFGGPLCIVSLIHLMGGVWLALRVNLMAAYLCVIGPVILGASYIIVMSSALGRLPINLLTLLLVFLPAFAAMRVLAFVRALPSAPPWF